MNRLINAISQAMPPVFMINNLIDITFYSHLAIDQGVVGQRYILPE